MKVYKENSFLIFDFEDGKTVKYDFATKKSYGFSGKEVNGLQNQLRNISFSQIKESCIDENYANFLAFVKMKESASYDIYNIGTILRRVQRYSRFEQIFSAGIKNVDSQFIYKIGIYLVLYASFVLTKILNFLILWLNPINKTQMLCF